MHVYNCILHENTGYSSYSLPYNGIFSRRQIFAVLSKKQGDYFSRILIVAVGNVREKYFRFFTAKIVEWVAQLDFPPIEQLCGKKISGPKYLKRNE